MCPPTTTPIPAGTEPTAPKATMALAGTGTTGPGRSSSAARAKCGSMSQLALFITCQTPLKFGCPLTRGIAAVVVAALCAATAGAGAASLCVSATAEAIKAINAGSIVLLFRTPPPVYSSYLFRPAKLLFIGIRAILRCAGAARAHEYLASIEESDIAAVCLAGGMAARILRTITAHDDLLAGLQR